MNKIILIFFIFSMFSCQKSQDTPIEKSSNHYYDKAYDLNVLGISDSAYVYYDKAQEIFKQNKDNIGIGKCLINKAIILTDRGDYYGGQELSLKARQYFDENNIKQYGYICSNYNNLGIASNNLKDYNNAIKFYDLAIKFSDTELNKYTYYKNKANTYKDQKNYIKAIQLYQDILPQVKNTDKKIYARLLSNFENVRFLNNPLYNPEQKLLEAIEMQKQINDKWGQNAGYSHLTDYYTDKDLSKALLYAERMYKIANEIKSPADRLDALKKITVLDSKNRLNSFKTYTYLADSIQAEKDKSDNKFAFIRYDVEKVKADNAEKENQLLLQYLLSALLIAAIVIIIVLYKKRQKRLHQENEIKLKNDQLRISKRVHDVVANGIYQVMTKIENQEDFDKENALDELEFVYEKSRDISYEKPDPENNKKEYKEKISTLIASFKNEVTETYTVGNEHEIWLGVSQSSFDEVYQILRELLVNVKKHSQASRVIFKFEKIDNMVKIQYTDNGIGIPGDMIYKNGLTNTGTRIAAIHGAIIFDNESEKGLKINISFPVS